MRIEGQITGEAVSFKAPSRFSHTASEMNGTLPMPLGSLTFENTEPGAPKDKPSFYRREFGGNYGVQVRNVARNDEGWRTYQEVQK